MTIHIRTNWHRREVVEAWQLNAKEREEFDYVNWAAIEAGSDSRSFVRYRGDLIDLNDMERGLGGTPNEMPFGLEEWSNFKTDSMNSGTCVKYVFDEFDSSEYDVVVGSFYYTSD